MGGDCFGPRYFSEGAQLPKKNTEVQNNHRRIHIKTKTKRCKVIIVINNWYLDILNALKVSFMKKYFTKLTSHSVSIYSCERISISPDLTINGTNNYGHFAWILLEIVDFFFFN